MQVSECCYCISECKQANTSAVLLWRQGL